MSSQLFATADDAEAAFYDAIERADLDALMAIWAEDDEITCIPPTGMRLNGLAEIREGWRHVFESGSRLRVRVTHKLAWNSALMAVRNVVETIYLGDDPTPHGPVLATNVYVRDASGWRIVAHHASTASEPPASESNQTTHTLH